MKNYLNFETEIKDLETSESDIELTDEDTDDSEEFEDALTDKIGQALDTKRQSVANDWLNAAQDLEATKDASGLDSVGVAPEGTVGTEPEETPEPIEIDQDEKENEQPAV